MFNFIVGVIWGMIVLILVVAIFVVLEHGLKESIADWWLECHSDKATKDIYFGRWYAHPNHQKIMNKLSNWKFLGK